MARDPDRMDRAAAVVWLAVTLCLTALTALDTATGSWTAAAFAGAYLGSWLVWPLNRKIWIGVGRHRARAAMYESLHEAHLRGLSFHDWFTAEIERDYGTTLSHGKDPA